MISLHSVRARLTVLNVVVLALVLVLLGGILRFTLQQTLLAAVDNHLRQLVEPMRHPPPGESLDQVLGGPGRGPPPAVNNQNTPPPGNNAQQGGDDFSSGNVPPDNNPQGLSNGPQDNGGQPSAPLPARPGVPPGTTDPTQPAPADQQGWGGQQPGNPPGPPPARRRRRHPPRGEYPPRLLDITGHFYGSPSGDDGQPYSRELFARSLGGYIGYGYTDTDNVVIRVYSSPVMVRGKVAAVVQAAQPMTDSIRSVDQLTRTLVLVSPLALLIVGLSGSLLASRALRPVKQLIRATETIEATDLAGRIPIEGSDEIAELSSTINSMFARLEQSFAQQAEAIRQLRQFTADASHELRTPLTVIKANTSLALTGPDDAESFRVALQEADWAADRMNAIVQDLLLLARSDAGTIDMTLNTVAVADVVDQAVRLVSRPDAAPIEIRPVGPQVKILADREAIERLIGNLVKNAQRHTPADGRITIVALADGPDVRITVADSGEGIAPQHLPHVFERFYRVDNARSRDRGGTGLGLPICKTIAEAHGGSIDITSTVGIGTQVTLSLPSLAAATGGGFLSRSNPRDLS